MYFCTVKGFWQATNTLFMAGIYIHTPFCKTRCIYCGFFSTTSLNMAEKHTERVCEELTERRNYTSEDIETIYFGGGTPSQLPVEHLLRILNCIYNIYNVRAKEITVECNPDDITAELLTSLRSMGVNRLSMGVQSFDDRRLNFIHRRHSASQARKAVKIAQSLGFDNISIDLMFGFPGQTLSEWKKDLEEAVSLGVQHISAYSLMYEEGTLLGRMLEEGKVKEISDETSLVMYELLIDTLYQAGYEQYEISNFALPGFRSIHNSSYWRGTPYLGVGAGAHSFDGKNRHFNPDSLDEYLRGESLEEEELDDNMRYDEFVFTSLRTSDGLSLHELERLFGKKKRDYCIANAQQHIERGTLSIADDTLRLTREGLFISNDIMSDLMWDE